VKDTLIKKRKRMRNKSMTMKFMRTTQRKKVKKNTVLKIMVRRSQRCNQLMTQLKSNLKIVSLLVISKEDIY
jgi:ribosomal 30S subunit maturation factor RimM